MNFRRIPVFIALLLTFMCLIGFASIAQPIRQTNPIIIQDNLVYIQVRVNGHGPYNFVLDLGLSGIGRIDQRVAKELRLNIVGFQENREGNKMKREFLVAVDKLSIGQLTHTSLKMTVVNRNEIPKQLPVDGVIGRDFFARYLITMDGPARELIVSGDTLAAHGKGVAHYNNPFLIAGKLGVKDVQFSVDTGSTLPLLFPKSSLTGVHYTDTTNQRVITQANTTFVLQEAILHDELVVGGIRLNDQKIYYSDKAHQINVGVDFLKGYVVSFDQRRKLVRLD